MAHRGTDDEYLKAIVRAIESDYTRSPYRWFKTYWNDHCDGWAKKLELDTFRDVIGLLKTCYDL